MESEECIQKILPVYWTVSGSPRGTQVPVQVEN